MTTTIPGLKAKHAIITPDCRKNRNDSGAMKEAFDRVLLEYYDILRARTDNPTFHLVLTVEGKDDTGQLRTGEGDQDSRSKG